jgi:hypothetical protein
MNLIVESPLLNSVALLALSWVLGEGEVALTGVAAFVVEECRGGA